jgi:hypothetical protein
MFSVHMVKGLHQQLLLKQSIIPTHASLLAVVQVVGFFVIEAAVQRLLPSVANPASLAFLWEGAASQLKVWLKHCSRLIRSQSGS